MADQTPSGPAGERSRGNWLEIPPVLLPPTVEALRDPQAIEYLRALAARTKCVPRSDQDEFFNDFWKHLQTAVLRYDRSRDAAAQVAAWLGEVMRNFASSRRDHLKSQRRDSDLENVGARDRAVDRQRRAEAERERETNQIDGPFFLPDDDLRRLEMAIHPPLKRVVVLVAMAVHAAVPPERWRAWVHEAGLADPFPEASFQDCDTKALRYAYLDDAMHGRRNLLSQWVRRSADALRTLPSIQKLRDDHLER